MPTDCGRGYRPGRKGRRSGPTRVRALNCRCAVATCLQLLFPGGAREVNKKVGQEYQLFWKESPDFVRLAARCGAIIVPFAAVGADDAYDGA